MAKRINWKNVSLTLLVTSNLLYMLDGTNQQHKIHQLETDLTIEQTEKNELTNERDELLNELYDAQVSNGSYNEYPTSEVGTRDPNNEQSDLYYRMYLKDNSPILVHIYSGEIILLPSNTQSDHGAIYDNEMNKVLNVKYDMDFIVHSVRWYERNLTNL